ncbi:DUF4174 domain-containing protein [Lutimonas vermicola]|uniref:DUF4174 domain-containing protein n=1 Tax=Lutimonas vermicola TaxID=414288 RepID=A0ABU9L322_9FLAO
MSNFKLPLLLILLLNISTIMGQQISDYQWKNRLVVLLTDSQDSQMYQLQLKDLKTDLQGLKERKILVITLTPNYQITGIDNGIEQKAVLNFKKLKKETDGFEVILVGLDGYVKLQQSKLLTHQELFAQIDRMPMRRDEIKKN